MNESIKVQLAVYVDDGMIYSNSAEGRSSVDSSEGAKEFYETVLLDNKRLEGCFQSKEMHKTNKKLHKFIDETLEPRDTFWTRWVPASGFMMAAVAMLITFGPFMSPVTVAPAMSAVQLQSSTKLPMPHTITSHQLTNVSIMPSAAAKASHARRQTVTC